MQNSTFKKLTKTCLYKTSLLFITLGEGYIIFILLIAVTIAMFLPLLFQLPFLLMKNIKMKLQVSSHKKYSAIKEMPAAVLN